MARVLVTGMSGAGKSTLLQAVARRGYPTVDTDYGGWTLPNGLWDEHRMASLLATHQTIAISGTVENQGRFYRTFDHVVLLSAPVEVLLQRVRVRAGNPYGTAPHHEAEIRRNALDVEPLLRGGATAEWDGQRPVEELADELQVLLSTGRHGGGQAVASR